jgi:hypothetical protein
MLSKAGLHEKAGDFFEHLGQLERARDSYRAGGTYRKAVDLARRAFPGQVCASPCALSPSGSWIHVSYVFLWVPSATRSSYKVVNEMTEGKD